jgi:acetyltransferase-like isoleucine patch superfamily enzyme
MDENANEVMEYWGYHGFFGSILFYCKFFANWIKYFLAMKVPIPYFRTQLQRMRGVKLGVDVYLGEDVIIDLLYPKNVIIGDYVDIGDRSLIYAHSRGTAPLKKIYPRKVMKVRIGEGTWIGNNVMILPGIKIGKYCVVGGSSVVTKDIPDYSLAVGSPAKVIRSITKEDIIILSRKKI